MAKLNAVIVLDVGDYSRGQINAVLAFTDDKEGNAEAEAFFRDWAKEAKGEWKEEVSEEDMNAYLDDGHCDVGEGGILILHTTGA